MPLSRVSVVLVEPVAMFEFSVAVEVFGIDRRDDGVPLFDFRVCSTSAHVPLETSSVAGLTLTAPHDLDGLSDSELVIVPASPIRPRAEYPASVLTALQEASTEGATVLSLCSGAFILAAAGLLDGRACTTHWNTPIN